MNPRYCGHGISIDKHCSACAALFRIDMRQAANDKLITEILREINELSGLITRASLDEIMRRCERIHELAMQMNVQPYMEKSGASKT